jgi:hypothetical protein
MTTPVPSFIRNATVIRHPNLGYENMTATILLFITRKPTITPAEFKTHWDTKHVELLKSIAGENFPLTHTRHYIARQPENGSWPAVILIGAQEDFSYDGIAELVFPDESALQTFFGIMSAPEAAARIAEDEETFSVREKMKMVVMGEKSVSTKDYNSVSVPLKCSCLTSY